MEALIRQIAENGQSQFFYSTINSVAFWISFCFSLWHGKKLGIALWKMLIILLVTDQCMGLIQGVINPILDIMKETNFLGIQITIASIVRVFVFVPLIAIPLARIFRLKWSLVCDALAFFPLFTSALGQLACIFPGCCHGYESIFGIYNPRTGLYHFPVQILETILTLAILAYLIYRLHRRAYVSDGMLYPEMMALYGLMRFICEAMRDNEKIFLGCSGVAFHALLLLVLGFSILLHKEKKNKSISIEAEPIPVDVPAQSAE